MIIPVRVLRGRENNPFGVPAVASRASYESRNSAENRPYVAGEMIPAIRDSGVFESELMT